MTDNFHLIFKSDFFKLIPGEDEATNPGCYGKALAEWLAEQLRGQGISVNGIFPEDFGWIVELSEGPCPLWFGCSNQGNDEDEGGQLMAWRIMPVVEPSMIQKLLKKVDVAAEQARLKTMLQQLLPTLPNASSIEWEEVP
ncbi:MAG: hypothetical protein ACRDD3_08665 [Azovibrio sp.]